MKNKYSYKNTNFNNAKKSKNDEFYTQLSDIEKELIHYKDQFKDKIVYCNCDNPLYSNFWKYFYSNFDKFKLKKLITTYFVKGKSKHNLLDDSKEYVYSYKWEISKDNKEIVKTKLFGDGDFRSPECIDLLKESDIVCTNPPFSLFREYVDLLVKYDKKFLIIGNNNSITYKEIFKLIKDNKLWLGYNVNKTMDFILSDNYEKYNYIDKNGFKHGKVPAITWFTNLDVKKRHEFLDLRFKSYKQNPELYPKYDNYNAINVNKVKDIPGDYNDAIGVPITYLEYYNPKQFEIIALGVVGSIKFTSNKKMEILDKYGNSTGKFTFNAKGCLYRDYNSATDKSPAFRDVENDKLYSSIYARIIIQKIKQKEVK